MTYLAVESPEVWWYGRRIAVFRTASSNPTSASFNLLLFLTPIEET